MRWNSVHSFLFQLTAAKRASRMKRKFSGNKNAEIGWFRTEANPGIFRNSFALYPIHEQCYVEVFWGQRCLSLVIPRLSGCLFAFLFPLCLLFIQVVSLLGQAHVLLNVPRHLTCFWVWIIKLGWGRIREEMTCKIKCKIKLKEERARQV